MSNDGDAGTSCCESWLRQYSTPLVSCDPEVPFSDQEKSCFDDLFASADLIGFGEMTHGSKQVFLLKDRLLRYLVKHRDVTIIVLESSLAATRALNDFVLGADSDPAKDFHRVRQLARRASSNPGTPTRVTGSARGARTRRISSRKIRETADVIERRPSGRSCGLVFPAHRAMERARPDVYNSHGT